MEITPLKPRSTRWNSDTFAVYLDGTTCTGTACIVYDAGVRLWFCGVTATDEKNNRWGRSFFAVMDDFGQLKEVTR